jgi:hypothetical protein
MEHRLNWITDDKSILLVEFIDAWTWDDLDAIMQEIGVLTTDNPTPFHLILKFMVRPPIGNPIHQFTAFANNRLDTIIDIFVVTPPMPSAVKSIFGTFAGFLDKMSGKKSPITVVASVDEACNLIDKQAARP